MRDQTRRDFETWATQCGYSTAMQPNDCYVDELSERLWEAWNNSATLAVANYQALGEQARFKLTGEERVEVALLTEIFEWSLLNTYHCWVQQIHETKKGAATFGTESGRVTTFFTAGEVYLDAFERALTCILRTLNAPVHYSVGEIIHAVHNINVLSLQQRPETIRSIVEHIETTYPLGVHSL